MDGLFEEIKGVKVRGYVLESERDGKGPVGISRSAQYAPAHLRIIGVDLLHQGVHQLNHDALFRVGRAFEPVSFHKGITAVTVSDNRKYRQPGGKIFLNGPKADAEFFGQIVQEQSFADVQAGDNGGDAIHGPIIIMLCQGSLLCL